MLKSLKSFFARPFRAEPAKPIPEIRKLSGVAIRAVPRDELHAYAIKTGGDNFRWQTAVCNSMTRNLAVAESLVLPRDRKRLVLLENIGIEHRGSYTHRAPFAGVIVGCGYAKRNMTTGCLHSYVWALPAKQVRFA